MGRGDGSLLSDPGSELRLGREKEKEKSVKIIDRESKREGRRERKSVRMA